MLHSKMRYFLPFLALLPSTYAWGALGHMTVAYIAQNFVTDDTADWAQDILGIHNSSYLASIATWADRYRYTAAGRFTSSFHFIDAEDSPPDNCSITYKRDCGDTGCLASAVNNYTARVQDKSLTSTQRQQALMFLVHFFGDATQPLHNENIERGGNGINVYYGSEHTNLHHVWDDDMPEELVGGYHISDAAAWAHNLTQQIVGDGGAYANSTDVWVQGMDLADPVGSVMMMAQDANAYVCSYVLAGGRSSVEGQDLSGEYYNGAVSIFETQIAKGGYRLAMWLNMLYNATHGGGGNDGGDDGSYRSKSDILLPLHEDDL